ncbi:hypothetical protein ABZ890_41945 [Streptomyces sp. NPDC046984]|uniref:hypothetical protein n=1 Tax=Streptomyces sp. NPDC046984 TaxID=3155138 RepID=UPI0033FDC49B
MPTAEDRALAGWLCAVAPELRAGALGDEEVLAWIDAALAAVRNGESAAPVCRRLGYPSRAEPDKHTGDLTVLDDFGFDPVVVQGEYRCPAGRCSRRSQADESGREPRCQVDDAPMILRAKP